MLLFFDKAQANDIGDFLIYFGSKKQSKSGIFFWSQNQPLDPLSSSTDDSLKSDDRKIF